MTYLTKESVSEEFPDSQVGTTSVVKNKLIMGTEALRHGKDHLLGAVPSINPFCHQTTSTFFLHTLKGDILDILFNIGTQTIVNPRLTVETTIKWTTGE